MGKTTGLLLALLSILALQAQAAEIAGEVGDVRGSLVAQRMDGTVKVLGAKSHVLEGDDLVTSKEGYAKLKMVDGSVMTLHPDSSVKIDSYKFRKEAPQSDNAIIRLLKGGFRTLTGLIGKRGNKDAYKLRASTATIGIRGTDFTTRLCAGKECQEGAREETARSKPALAVGRVMLLNGTASIRNFYGRERKVALGSPVYERDTINTDAQSNAVVAFRDESRVTVQSGSSFYVEQFKYEKAKNQENAVLHLLKGTVRVVTGLIGRIHHENFHFGIGGATIGIRGTGFDAWCNGGCAAANGNPGATQDDPLDGSGVYVWSGAVVLNNAKGSFDVGLRQAAIIARNTGKPVALIVVPRTIIDNPAPRPDGVPVDVNKEFSTEESSGAAGVYVTVHDGLVVLTQNNNQLFLGKGESGFAGGRVLQRLQAMPGFMRNSDLHSLDSINSNPSINPVGCVVQ